MKPLLACALALLTSCATQFEGAPHVPGGPHGCAQICSSWGMVLVGMVQMGEYSDGCICQVPNLPPTSAPGAPGTAAQGATAAAPAVAGVIMQMRRAAQRQQHGRGF